MASRLTGLAGLLLVAFSIVVPASAHMEMSKPLPFRSTLDPATPEAMKDYTMTAPLFPDGSNFPCKGYHKGAMNGPSKDTLTAGKPYTIDLTGDAPHNGGSCQMSLSYDGGKNFLVINSVIGGCPLESSYTFDVPKDVPGGKKVLFSWTWFNKSGNREMYQNCALVDVKGVTTKGAKFTAPTIYRANIFGNTCITTEGDEIAFPEAGRQVEYGGKWASARPRSPTRIAGCSVNESKSVTLTVGEDGVGAVVAGGGGGPHHHHTKTSSSAATPTEAAPAVQKPTPATTEDAPAPATTHKKHKHRKHRKHHTKAKPAKLPKNGHSCTGQPTIKCSANGQTWSMCGVEGYIFMGPVAAGTRCTNGQLLAAQSPKMVKRARR